MHALPSLARALLFLLAALTLGAPSALADSPPPHIQPAARQLAAAVAAKIGQAQTLRVRAQHFLYPAPGVGPALESGPIHIALHRPNRFYALQPARQQTRELAFDGKFLCLMTPHLDQHALEPLPAASMEQFAERLDARFGFRPPLAELLAPDLAAQLFLHVTSARLLKPQRIGWTRCHHLQLQQPGLTSDLWIATRDLLPRRYRLAFSSPQRCPTWDIHLSHWELNAPIDPQLFAKRPAPTSQKLTMLRSRSPR